MKTNFVSIKSIACLLAASLAFSSCDNESETVAPVSVTPTTEASKDAGKVADDLFDKEVQQAISSTIKAISQMESTCDKSIDHASVMLIHHELMLKLAEAEIKYGDDPNVLLMADKAKSAHTAKISELKAFLETQPVPVPLPQNECSLYLASMKQHTMDIIQCMKKVKDTPDPDADYVALMNCHPEGCNCKEG
ncbi:DUF305 domain-containing protein [Pontibacter mangrovi]|uniref:DUF305 domain-containing protein n=1 Tax=Pontibacter mangrovi TaxID=2589816 RepID=A0A501WKM7_9BACT|nr:DUF305 domain-containing protein [Pontibacter mangrovi]TPE46196.1 DUF305 domain-containing protein [Pontibacter mangrovi]